MSYIRRMVACGAVLAVLAQVPPALIAATFSVATYNLENYLDEAAFVIDSD